MRPVQTDFKTTDWLQPLWHVRHAGSRRSALWPFSCLAFSHKSPRSLPFEGGKTEQKKQTKKKHSPRSHPGNFSSANPAACHPQSLHYWGRILTTGHGDGDEWRSACRGTADMSKHNFWRAVRTRHLVDDKATRWPSQRHKVQTKQRRGASSAKLRVGERDAPPPPCQRIQTLAEAQNFSLLFNRNSVAYFKACLIFIDL